MNSKFLDNFSELVTYFLVFSMILANLNTRGGLGTVCKKAF